MLSKKKWIVLICAAALTLSACTACGGSSSSEGGNNTSSTAQASKTPAQISKEGSLLGFQTLIDRILHLVSFAVRCQDHADLIRICRIAGPVHAEFLEISILQRVPEMPLLA